MGHTGPFSSWATDVLPLVEPPPPCLLQHWPASPKPQANYILLLVSFLCQGSDHSQQQSHQCRVLVLRGRAAAVGCEVHRPLGLLYRRSMWQFPAEMLSKSRTANLSFLDSLSPTTLNLPGSHMFWAPGPRRSGRAILFSQPADSFHPVSVSVLSLTLLFCSSTVWYRWEVICLWPEHACNIMKCQGEVLCWT